MVGGLVPEDRVGIRCGCACCAPWLDRKCMNNVCECGAELLSEQLPSECLMGLELAGVHARADLLAEGAKTRRTPLDEKIDIDDSEHQGWCCFGRSTGLVFDGPKSATRRGLLLTAAQ